MNPPECIEVLLATGETVIDPAAKFRRLIREAMTVWFPQMNLIARGNCLEIMRGLIDAEDLNLAADRVRERQAMEAEAAL